MSLCQINYTYKNCGFPGKFDKMLIIYKSIKMAIFTKNTPKYTDQSVYHNKKTLKIRRKQATAVRMSAKNFLYLWWNTNIKTKIYILATQSTLHNIYNKKTRLIGRVIQKTNQRYITATFKLSFAGRLSGIIFASSLSLILREANTIS